MYPDYLNMYVYTDQEEHSDAQQWWTSQQYQAMLRRRHDFSFSWAKKVRYEFILIRTDTTRGPKSVKGNKTISLLSYLSSFALTMMKSPSAYQLYRLARTRSKIPRIRRRYTPHNVKYKASKHVKTLQNMLRTQTFAQNEWDPQTQSYASLDSQRRSLEVT